MKKLITILSMTCINVFGQLSPAITSWSLNPGNSVGYGNFRTNVLKVQYDANFAYVRTNDVPDYMPANAGPPPGLDWWPNNPWFPDSMGYTFKIRLNPTPQTGSMVPAPYGHIGVWRNGVSIYNPKDAKSYNSLNVWFQNAFYWEHLLAETFDVCWGHPNGSHEYHTHQSPACLYDVNANTVHSPLVGYAFDGYPIYGAHAYTNTDGTGPIKRMVSSYRLRNITDRTTLVSGPITNTLNYGPSIATVPLGGYMEDYEYVPGLGDLDSHNGRFAITPEYPTGTYAYYTTLDVNNIPTFPYVLGEFFYGVTMGNDGNMGPNSGYVNVPGTAVTYTGSTVTTLTENETLVNFEIFPNPTADQINFIVNTNDYYTVYKGEIYNQSGQLVIEGEVRPNVNNPYNTSDLKPGIYYLKIYSSKKTFTSKFIVTK
jgi:hypothetical protein